VRISLSVILACGSLRWWSMWSKSSGMQKVAMILSSLVDLRVRGGIVPAHTGRLDKVASWVPTYRFVARWNGSYFTDFTSAVGTIDASGITIRAGVSNWYIYHYRYSNYLGRQWAHWNGVYGMALSPDESIVASVGGDYTVRLWRASDFTLLHTFVGHAGTVRAVAFSEDGRLLASGGDDGTVCVYDLQTGARLYRLVGHCSRVQSLAFSPDGAYLVLGSDGYPDGSCAALAVWRLSDGALYRSYDQEMGMGVRTLAFSPDGSLLACGREDATMMMLEGSYHLRGRESDTNGDGCVDDSDLLAVLFGFGSAGSGQSADVNRDGVVDDADLLQVLVDFGWGCRE